MKGMTFSIITSVSRNKTRPDQYLWRQDTMSTGRYSSLQSSMISKKCLHDNENESIFYCWTFDFCVFFSTSGCSIVIFSRFPDWVDVLRSISKRVSHINMTNGNIFDERRTIEISHGRGKSFSSIDSFWFSFFSFVIMNRNILRLSTDRLTRLVLILFASFLDRSKSFSMID